MKKSIKVCYSIRANLGNALNPLIIERILGRKVEWANEYDCETSGIGSGLRLFFKSANKLRQNNVQIPPSQIWSAGFLTTPSNNVQPIKVLYISSVRGELSKEIMRRIYGDTYHITTGDAGLLSSELVHPSLYKKYSVGIIPHDRERNERQFYLLHINTPKSIIIDVRENPLNILRKISMCECVISSSLHGLIVADSLTVPNKWVKLTDKLLGDGFKFRDYYSIYNIENKAFDINNIHCVDIEYVINDYSVPENVVNSKKQIIIDSFYKYI